MDGSLVDGSLVNGSLVDGSLEDEAPKADVVDGDAVARGLLPRARHAEEHGVHRHGARLRQVRPRERHAGGDHHTLAAIELDASELAARWFPCFARLRLALGHIARTRRERLGRGRGVLPVGER